jgi:hypothetical protein
MTEGLRSLLIGAAEAPPNRRFEWRERIARHGDIAVRALADWLHDEELREFALSTIVRAAELGAAPIALAVLKQAGRGQLDREWHAEIERATDRISRVRPIAPRARPTASVAQLVRGQIYRRTELHEAGLGGNRQTGISYPADGGHAMLLTTVGGGEHYGYRDRWAGDDFLYYGEWKGTPEMSLTGGNAAIINRSPNLYLFASQGKGSYRFEGAFEYLTHTTEWTQREGNQQRAIVFRLRRVSDAVEL